MKGNNLVDFSFGMGKQARAVLAMLDIEPSFAEYKDGFYRIYCETRPWYNGREQGFVLSVSSHHMLGSKWIHVACFEHRNSDSVCALRWETKSPYLNHPLEDPNIFERAYGKGASKYDVAFSVEPGECGKMADWIYETIANFYTENHAPEGR